MVNNPEPQILALLCNWCSYTGADMAGISRVQYKTNVRSIRVMCSGRVDPSFILRGFRTGFDGVLVLGCHLGDCHYIAGNYHTEKKMNRLTKLLKIIGIAGERFQLDWVSATEGTRFGQVVDTFTANVKQQGLIIRDNLLLQKLHAAELTMQSSRIRWLLGNELNLLEKEDVYGEKIALETLDETINEAIGDEFFKNWLVLIMKDSVSMQEMAAITGLDSQRLSAYLTELEEAGEIHFNDFEKKVAKYVKS